MSEKTIALDSVEPLEILGANDSRLNQIKKHFPELRIIARGYSLKVIGSAEEIGRFEKKLKLLFEHYHKTGVLTEAVIERLLGQTGDNIIQSKTEASDIILFGSGGLV